MIVALGVLAIVAALAYTGGPWPYGYRALGEVFVFIFFGLVAVVGTAYLQALRLDAIFFVAAIPVGALITAILVVNNLRDIPTDAAAGKRTLAVGLGSTRDGGGVRAPARRCVRRAGGAPRDRPRSRPASAAVLGPAGGPIAAHGSQLLSEPRQLNAVLAGTARLALVFGALFAIALALPGWPS